MRLPPKKRDENILTRHMRNTILTTAVFFIVVMLFLLVGMEKRSDGTPGWFAGVSPSSTEFPELTVRQVSIFFTVYVMFQVWNEINCRSLVPDVSGFHGLVRNPIFLAIIGITVLGQVVIVTFGGDVFKVEPLNVLDWLVIAAATASVLVFAEVARRVRQAMARAC
jgi:Ca2+-transporting ATPase